MNNLEEEAINEVSGMQADQQQRRTWLRGYAVPIFFTWEKRQNSINATMLKNSNLVKELLNRRQILQWFRRNSSNSKTC